MNIDQTNPFLRQIEERQRLGTEKVQAFLASQKAMQQQQATDNQFSSLPVIQPLPAHTWDVAPSTPEEPGFWDQLTGRAVPQLTGTLYGAGALLADLVGADTVRDNLMQGYSENMAEAEQVPRTVSSISDVNWDVGRFGTWAKEELIDQIPLLAVTMGAGSIGGLVGRKFATNALSAAVERKIGEQAAKIAAEKVAQGMAATEAEAFGKAAATQLLNNSPLMKEAANQAIAKGLQRGASAGLYPTMGALEGGSAYATDYTTHGPEGTSPFKDLGVGVVSALFERALGVEGSIVRRLTGVPVAKATEEAVKQTFLKQLPKLLLTNAGKEGVTEMLQEVTQAVNENIQDNRALLTVNDVTRLVDSFAAGALLGGVLGGAEGAGAAPRSTDSNISIDQAAERAMGIAQSVPPTYSSQLALPPGQQMLALPPGAQQLALPEGTSIPMPSGPISTAIPQGPASIPLDLTDSDVEKFIHPSERIASGITALKDIEQSTTQQIQSQYQQGSDNLKARSQEIQQRIRLLNSQPAKTSDLQLARKQELKSLERELISNSARMARLKTDRDTSLKKLNTQAIKQSNKLQKDLITGATKSAANAFGSEKDYRDKVELVRQASVFANRQTQMIDQRLEDIQKKITQTEQLLSVQSPETLADLPDVLAALKKDKARLVNTSARLRKKTSVAQNLITGRTQITTPLDIDSAVRDVYDTVDSNILKEDSNKVSSTSQVVTELEQKQQATTPPQFPAQASDFRLPPLDVAPSTTTLTDRQFEQTRPNIDGIRPFAVTVIQNLLDKLPSQVKNSVVFASSADLAELVTQRGNDVYRWNGWYRNGKVYLNLSRILEDFNLTTAQDFDKHIEQVVVHELVGHFGLRALMTDTQRNALLTGIHNRYSKTDLWKETLSDYDEATLASMNKQQQAEEFIAEFAAKLPTGNVLPTTKAKELWNTVTSFLRKILTKLGLGDSSTEYIRSIVERSSRAVRSGQVPQVAAPTEAAPSVTATAPPYTREAREAERQNKTLTQKVKEVYNERSNLFEKAMTNLVDSNRPVQRMIKALHAGGGKITYETNLYRNLERMSNQIATELRHRYVTTIEPILAEIASMRVGNEDAAVTFARADDYAGALAAVERNKLHGAGAAGISTKRALEIIERNASPEMNRVVSLLQDLHKDRMNILRDNNIIPAEKLDAWEAAYEYYMPFKDWESFIQDINPSWYKSDARRNISTPSAQKRIGALVEGRSSESQSPILHSFLQLYDTVALKHKVDAQRQLLQLVRDNPDATDLFRVLDPSKPEDVGFGAESIACIDNDANLVRVLIKDPELRGALKGENIAKATGLIASIGNISRFLGKIYTSLSPLFWLTNPVRDSVTAALNMTQVTKELEKHGLTDAAGIAKSIITKGILKVGSKKGLQRALLSYYNTGKIDAASMGPEAFAYAADLPRFMAEGAQSEYFGTNTYDVLKRDVYTTLRDKSPANAAQKGMAVTRGIIQYMENVSSSLENMTRYIAFKEISDALKAGGMKEGEAFARASSIALNLTVNFSRKGSWSPVFNSLYLFSSASIGGSVRVLENIFAKNADGKVDMARALKFAAVPMAAYTLQAVVARSLMPDDDDGINTYDKIPDYIKESNIILPSPLGKGDYIKIPLPYGFNVLWAAAKYISDGAINAATGKPVASPASAATSIVKSFFDNFSPLGNTEEGWTMFVPSAFRPVVQISTNKNFAGNPIYPESTHLVRGHIPDSEKYWSTTSSTVIALARKMNELTGGSTTRSGLIDVSPETIEHTMNSYLGGMGRLTMGMINTAVNLAEGGKDVGLADIPGVSTFYKTQSPSDTSSIFTKLRLEVQTQANTVAQARRTPGLSVSDKAEIFQDNRAGVMLEGQVKRANSALNKLREEENKLSRNTSLSTKAINERREALQKRKQAVMKQFIKQATKAGVHWEN